MFEYRIEDVTFKYIKNDVIHDVSLNFSRNSINVFLGLNGSGKTTLIKLLAGILKPDIGKIFINREDIQNYTYLERSKYISYVTQEINHGNDHFVRDYLSFGLMNTLKFYESPSLKHTKRVEEAAKKFDIVNFLDKKMNQLSGGEKQIVSICRAYIQDTQIMILDEPTSALDFKNQNLILNILKEVAGVGKTIILSSHNPNHALYLESNTILIKDGIVLKTGPAMDIVTKEVLSPVYGKNIVYSKDLCYNEITIG